MLESTVPADDAVLDTAPVEVVLRFSERVETALGSVRVFDGTARRVDEGSITRPSDEEIAVRLERPLADGTYTVAWRAISGDSHPVHGAFVFHVGSPGANPGGVAVDAGSSGGVSAAFTAVRFLDLALILLCAGGAVALLVVLGAAEPRVRAGLLRLLAGLAAALVPTALAGIVLQGAVAGGFSLGEALDRDVVAAVLDTRFGHVWLAQAGAGAAIAVLALAGAAGRRWAEDAASLLAVLLVVAPALSGHASVGGPWTFIADVVHVQAAAAWTGALAFLLVALARSGEGRWTLASRAVPRFSTLAVGAVAVLVVAGLANAYLEVRAWRGLWETTYGQLLLAKTALVLPLLALGAFNNRVAVPRLRAGRGSPPERRRFVRTAGAELVLVVAVVAVTAVLVAEPPARAAVAPEGPYAAEVHTGSFIVDLVVDPARAGANLIHLYLLDHAGGQAKADAVTLAVELPSRSVGPLSFEGVRAGPGHFVVPAAHLALAGRWRIEARIRTGELDVETASFDLPIGKD